MIFLMQSGINKTRIARALRTRTILSIFEKIYLSLTHSKLHSKSCDYRYKKSYTIYLCNDEFSGVKH